MKRKLNWLILGVLIGLCVAVFQGDVRDFAWAAATHFDRIVLGTDNFGTDPNPTADLTFQYDEYITNATDGTVGFGAANLVTTGGFTLGEAAHKELVANITITTTEVLALNATPDTMISAPGANYAIIFLSALAFLDYNDAAYDGVDVAEDLIISYTDGSGEIVAKIETTGFIDQTNDELRVVYPSTGIDGADNAYIVPVANKPLCISLLSAEIATGTSPLKLAIHYKIVPTDL